MARKDLIDETKMVSMLVPDTYTTPSSSSAVDLSGFLGKMVVINTGTITDGNHHFRLQHSDEQNSGFVSVPSDFVTGDNFILTSLDSDKTFKIAYLGQKRYIRVLYTISGQTQGGVYEIVAVLGHALSIPT